MPAICRGHILLQILMFYNLFSLVGFIWAWDSLFFFMLGSMYKLWWNLKQNIFDTVRCSSACDDQNDEELARSHEVTLHLCNPAKAPAALRIKISVYVLKTELSLDRMESGSVTRNHRQWSSLLASYAIEVSVSQAIWRDRRSRTIYTTGVVEVSGNPWKTRSGLTGAPDPR